MKMKENEIDDIGYQSEEYIEVAHEDDENNHSNEIEQDEEPTRGTLWLKGRVNKDGEYQDDEIRSVGDKLKETEDKIKEGTLQVDQGIDAMTLVNIKSTDAGKTCHGKRKKLLLKVVRQDVTDRGNVSPVEIHPINSDEDGGTTVVGCDQNDASIRKEMQKRAKYAFEILKKHSMEKSDTVGILMATKPKLDSDLSGKLFVHWMKKKEQTGTATSSAKLSTLRIAVKLCSSNVDRTPLQVIKASTTTKNVLNAISVSL
ncbi:hypothetical protein Tco_0877853 [Tanacetum coccineum]|uniref:Uncharacterized protein n=1 Tax=Tanacetum coccineum TaxID=301880 RepID=A0ABQ5BYR4_9ASTR